MDDSLGTSFLDLLTCALAAFIIFAIMSLGEITQSTPTSRSRVEIRQDRGSDVDHLCFIQTNAGVWWSKRCAGGGASFARPPDRPAATQPTVFTDLADLITELRGRGVELFLRDAPPFAQAVYLSAQPNANTSIAVGFDLCNYDIPRAHPIRTRWEPSEGPLHTRVERFNSHEEGTWRRSSLRTVNIAIADGYHSRIVNTIDIRITNGDVASVLGLQM